MTGPSAPAVMAELIGDWYRAHPGRSAIFSVDGWTREKLQVLRWAAYDLAEASPGMVDVLASAFEDASWEVRVTALIAAGRLGARALAREAAGAALPDAPGDGLGKAERRLLRAVRAAVLVRLGAPGAEAEAAPIEAAQRARIDAWLAQGPPSAGEDWVALWFDRLSLPVPEPVPPDTLPAGVAEGPQGYHLAEEDGTLLCWVPPGTYWLGDGTPKPGKATPPRRRVLARGLFVEARRRGNGTFEEARAAAADGIVKGRTAGPAAALPSAAAWEMAARGPDGRRFPWGNDAGAAVDLSPFGLCDLLEERPEWVLGAPGEPDAALLMGGGRTAAAVRRAPRDYGRAAGDGARGRRDDGAVLRAGFRFAYE